ncbi:hypothetical protein C1A50_0549 [Paenibacillus polymyxa]|nr:hypothetical protein C1A50_0549 [Paenibacillus polymyxa]
MIILDIVFSKKGRLGSMNNAYEVLEERIFEWGTSNDEI